jgi:hypothetical protein
MADGERKRRNASKMREIVNLLETRVWDTLAKASHFDVDVHLSVKDGAIQQEVQVTIRHKDKLD